MLGAQRLGQLGDDTLESKSAPTTVVDSSDGAPLTGVQALALGGAHTCALLTEDRVHCWGRNGQGQLGNGGETQTTTIHVPVLQSPGGPAVSNAKTLALGYDHACVGVGGGQAICWGDNFFGQIGDGTTNDRSTPVPLSLPPGGPLVIDAAPSLGNAHSCVINTEDGAFCWGDNFFGQLGNGVTTDGEATPLPVTVLRAPGQPLSDVARLSVGSAHSCAILSGNEVRCWGRNDSGQLGDDTTNNQSFPVSVKFGSAGVAPTTRASGVGLPSGGFDALKEVNVRWVLDLRALLRRKLEPAWADLWKPNQDRSRRLGNPTGSWWGARAGLRHHPLEGRSWARA